VAFGKVETPPVKPVGAVRFAAAGNTFLLAMTGTDGTVRFATASAPAAAQTPQFGAWNTVPGLSSAAEPALVGRASGGVEVYVVSSADSRIHRALYSSAAASWSPWSALSGVGSTDLVGAPAAVALDSTRTELLAASSTGGLVTASGPSAAEGAGTGTEAGTGAWQAWHVISAAGTVKPGVALAARPDGAQAAFVVRASDQAVLRLSNAGSSAYAWGQSFSTGAVGQPESAYTGAGKPYLFVQTAAGDIQIYEPSGSNLRGAQTTASAGVTSHNPPGVAALPDRRLVVCVTAADGAVRLYASTV
jgi:serine/threonine-protein kinase